MKGSGKNRIERCFTWIPCNVVLMLLLSSATIHAQESTSSQVNTDDTSDLFDMSIEQLMELEIGTGSLTKTTRRQTPSAVTYISREDIRRSGARSLFEILDIYVPNFQWIHDADGQYRNMGLRGSISYRDNKYLLLVNGRCMNEKTDFGAFSERDLPMLTDIHHIDVVRGPGSTLYGPGAMMMVINIITETAETFQGFETTQRFGAIENFYSTEFKYGRKLKDDAGLFIYGGWSEYHGSSLDHGGIRWNSNGLKPLMGASSGTKNQVYRGGLYHRYNEGFGPKVKLHAQYQKGNFDLWARYTQGGEYLVIGRDWTSITRGNTPQQGTGYRQATITAKYLQELASDLSMEYTVSYDRYETRTTPAHYYNASKVFYRSFREDEYYLRTLLRWNPQQHHSFAFGFAWDHDEFGLDPIGEDQAAFYQYSWFHPNPGNFMERWSMDMFSMFGEYQWNICDQWTLFLSGRWDDHEYADHAWSPRGTLVYMPTAKDTFKFIGARSVRMNNATTMISTDAKGNPNADVETYDSYEARYERQHTDALLLAVGAFTNRIILNEYNSTLGSIAPIGHEEIWGLEAEATYKTDKSRITFSHAYTKLHDIKYHSGVTHTKHSLAPYGHGDDLQNWFNNITKVHLWHELDDQWCADSSFIAYWNNPGGEDTVDYALEYQGGAINRNNPEDKAPFGPHFYWNLGLEYKPSENLLFRVDAYNILGWIEDDWNLRRIGMNSHRATAALEVPPSLSFQMTYKF